MSSEDGSGSARTISHIARHSLLASTEEGRTFLQGRIALFARLMFTVCVLYFTFLGVMLWRFPEIRRGNTRTVIAFGVIGSALMGTVWWAARRPTRKSAFWVMCLDFGSVVDPACLVGVGIYLMRDQPIATFLAFLGGTFLVFGRALIVPSTAAWTAVVSSAGMIAVLAGHVVLALLHPDKLLAPAPVQIGAFTIWSTVAVVVSSLGSGVIYGLREQVREARQLGQYTLVEKIGEGGMGAVYRARHAMLRRETAIKLLPPHRSSERDLRRFEREVQSTAELTHPNTVAIYDYGRSPEGTFYYVMELLDGIDLETLVRRDGPQPAGRVARILAQVCGALAEAHGRGLVHRDIKPANILLCHRGGVPDVVKVLDFGLVREVERDPALTDVNVVAGTPTFMAPEAITAPDTVGPKTDLYAVGAVAYYLVTGCHVFEGATVVDICGKHVHATPERPSERLGKPIPEGLEALVLECLAKDPARRPRSAQSIAAALAELHDGWTEEQAEAWWQEQGKAAPAPSPKTIGLASTIEVDLRARD